MAHHNAFYLVALAITATIGPSCFAGGFSHRGIVVDASTKQPLKDVLAVAATSNKIVGHGDCPTYDGFAAQAMSKADGSFTLRIPSTVQAYFVTYCRAQYEVFTPTEQNDNAKDGDAITPAPIRLWRLEGGADQMYAALKSVRDDTRNHVVALKRRDSVSFATAIQRLSEQERQLVTGWVETSALRHDSPRAILAAVTPQLTKLQDDKRITTADEIHVQLTGSLRSLQTTLLYFETASPAHFHAQLQRFSDLHAYLKGPEPPPEIQRTDPPLLRPPVIEAPCGSLRAAVAAAADDAQIGPDIADVSLYELRAIARPGHISLNTPRLSAESLVFRLYVEIAGMSMASDGAVDLLLRNEQGSILAVVSPACVGQSRFADAMKRVYARFVPYPHLEKGDLVVVEALAFFPPDTFSLDGATQIQLQPVLRIEKYTPRIGDQCCFSGPYGPDACPLNLSGPLPLNSPCTCKYPSARFVGRVCNPLIVPPSRSSPDEPDHSEKP